MIKNYSKIIEIALKSQPFLEKFLFHYWHKSIINEIHNILM